MSGSALLFDFGGTLDSNGTSWLNRFYPLYTRKGLSITREAFSAAFYAADDRLPSRFRLGNLGLADTVRLQVQSVLEALAPGKSDYADVIASEFLSESRRYFAANRPILAELSRDFSLGIVSNFYGNLECVLRGEGLLPYFRIVVDSALFGAAKPDRRIFEYAACELHANPMRSWMIGDSLNRDMRGAENFGLKHIWLRESAASTERCCGEGKSAASLKQAALLVGSA